MRYSACFLFFFLAFTKTVICQPVLSIETGSPENRDTVIISVWNNGVQQQFDSAYLVEGKAKVVLPTSLPQGMLMLRFQGSTFLPSYMLIYSGQNIRFTIKEDEQTKSPIFEISGQTEIFNLYNHKIDSFNNRIMKLSALQAQFSDDPFFVQKVSKHLVEVISAGRPYLL